MYIYIFKTTVSILVHQVIQVIGRAVRFKKVTSFHLVSESESSYNLPY